MAVVNPPSFMQNVATEQANSGRMLLSGLVPCPGVVGTNDLKSVQHAGTPGMSIDIPGGQVFIAGTESGIQGTYHAWSDSTVTNPSVAASDPTNPRIDRIVAKVRDQFYSTAFNQWDLAVVTGIAKAVPLLSDAAAPNNSYTLGSILVTAAKTSILNADITDLRNRAVGLGAGGQLINGYQPQTSPQASITAEIALTGLSITVNIPANRKVKVSQQTFPGSGSVANQVVTTNIKEGSTALMQSNATIAFSGGNQTLPSSVVLSPTAGVHTYFLSMSAGTGNVSNGASSTFPSFIIAEDIGPV